MDNNNNASTKNQTNIGTLSKQRNAFIRGNVINPNDLPLNNNPRNTNNNPNGSTFKS
jgi:hypothetical protein